MTKEKAIKILKEHGWTEDQLTVVDRNGDLVQGTSFNDEFGMDLIVSYEKFYRWLGY